jgi:V-type H+-transporting ATPase subunit a
MNDFSDMNPPSYFRTNVVIQPFQDIVDTYGIPSYKEVNPAIFTIVTFPFLFAVMFGDIGHGVMLLLFALFLVYKDENPPAALAVLAKARYMLLLLGIYAIYCGFIYNDFMAIPLNVFGASCYK